MTHYHTVTAYNMTHYHAATAYMTHYYAATVYMTHYHAATDYLTHTEINNSINNVRCKLVWLLFVTSKGYCHNKTEYTHI